MKEDRPTMLQVADQNFPVIMKFGGLLGAIVATTAALLGQELGAPLLALFGTMMAGGQLTEAKRHSDRQQGDR